VPLFVCIGTLELFRQCGIICFDMGFWNCSDSVALFIFIWNFGTVPIVYHYWFFLLDFGTVSTVWHYCFFYWTLELFRQLCHYWFFIVFIHNLLLLNLKCSLRNTVVYMNICSVTWRVTLVEEEVFTLRSTWIHPRF
jgi:hypothetical protein